VVYSSSEACIGGAAAGLREMCKGRIEVAAPSSQKKHPGLQNPPAP